MSTHANRVKMTVTSVASAGVGTITLNAASSGYRSFATAYGANATVDILITEGTAWEIARDCTYTHSGTTVTRGTLENSSTGSAVTFTSAAIVSVIATAAYGNNLELQLNRGLTHARNDGSTTQTTSSGVYTKIAGALTTVDTNPYSWWDTTNKKFLPNRVGTYLFYAGVQFNTSATSVVQPALYLNGSLYANSNSLLSSTGYPAITIALPIVLNGSTDYVEFWTYTAAAYTTHPSTAATYFSAVYLGP